MRRQRQYAFTISWMDMLYCMISVFAFLFLLKVTDKPAESKPGVEMKAEFLITMTWPKGSLDDIDLHLLMPDGRMVNFKTDEQGYVVLDHDDIGVNGSYVAADGTATLLEHKEMITVRAIVPGTYVVNVHVYRLNASFVGRPSDQALPYSARVKIQKLNPRVEDLAEVDVPLARLGEQKTAFAFTVDEKGRAVIDRDADRPFIPTAPTMGMGDGR